MADASLDILVRTQGDTSGAQKVKDSLQETTKETVRSAGAHGEAAKAAEKHTAGLHAMHKVFHALNELVPGLGVVMQAAFSPVGAAISIAVMALRAFHEKMRETNEEFRKMEEEAARPLTNRLEAQRETVVENATSLEGLRERLEGATRGEQTLKEETERAVAVMRHQNELAATLAEASQSNDLAQLEEMHALGLVSEEEYAVKRLDIEANFQKKKRQIAERAEMTEILMKGRQVELAEIQQPDMEAAAKAAEEKHIKALEDLNSLLPKQQLEENKNKTEAALKAWDEKHGPALEKAKADLERDLKLGFGAKDATNEQAFGLLIDQSRLAKLQDERDKLAIAAAGAERDWKLAPGNEARKKVAEMAAAREAERASRAAESNQAFITDTQRDLERRRGSFDVQRETNAQIDKEEAAATNARKIVELNRTPAGAAAIDDVTAAISTARAFEQHKQVSDQSKNQLTNIASTIAGQHVSLQQAVEVMERVARKNGGFVAAVERLAAVVVTLEQRMERVEANHNTRTQPGL
jgi:hypothetical protein